MRLPVTACRKGNGASPSTDTGGRHPQAGRGHGGVGAPLRLEPLGSPRVAQSQLTEDCLAAGDQHLDPVLYWS